MTHHFSTLRRTHGFLTGVGAITPCVFVHVAQAYVSNPKMQLEIEHTHPNNSDRSSLQRLVLTCWNGVSGDFSVSVWPRWALLLLDKSCVFQCVLSIKNIFHKISLPALFGQNRFQAIQVFLSCVVLTLPFFVNRRDVQGDFRARMFRRDVMDVTSCHHSWSTLVSMIIVRHQCHVDVVIVVKLSDALLM